MEASRSGGKEPHGPAASGVRVRVSNNDFYCEKKSNHRVYHLKKYSQEKK